MKSTTVLLCVGIFCTVYLSHGRQLYPKETKELDSFQLLEETNAAFEKPVIEFEEKLRPARLRRQSSDWQAVEQSRIRSAKELQAEVKRLGNVEKGVWVAIGCLIPVSLRYYPIWALTTVKHLITWINLITFVCCKIYLHLTASVTY